MMHLHVACWTVIALICSASAVLATPTKSAKLSFNFTGALAADGGSCPLFGTQANAGFTGPISTSALGPKGPAEVDIIPVNLVAGDDSSFNFTGSCESVMIEICEPPGAGARLDILAEAAECSTSSQSSAGSQVAGGWEPQFNPGSLIGSGVVTGIDQVNSRTSLETLKLAFKGVAF